jgi:hypothetical protein
VPRDILAVIRAIYDDPKGKVAGTKAWFRIARGVRQGCVLGSTMFLATLEMWLRCTPMTDLGVSFCFVSRKSRPLPGNLKGKSFVFRFGG